MEFNKDGNLVITFTDGTTQTVETPKKEEHVHTFGEWTALIGEDTSSDSRLYFRICSGCNSIEWKQVCTNHTWNIVTTSPTCQAKGYDTKTCKICGKVEIDNYTDIVDHDWKTEYFYDNSFHWHACSMCDNVKDKTEHTPDASGECSVCGALVGATEGVCYDVSADSTYAEVIGYEGTATKVRIADTYNSLPVKTIYEKAFYNKTITSVIIPDSVTSIGDSAFSSCDRLTSITIPESITSIGSSAFYSCRSLTNVIIGDSVTSIGVYAFHECSSLTSVTIPDGVTSIKSDTFSYCSNLTSVTIPDSVTSIGFGAFRYCYSLTNITIPDSVTSIGEYAFYDCSSLTSVTIPDSVTSIMFGVFYGCNSLVFTEYGNCQFLGNENNPYLVLIQTKNQNYSSYTIHENTKIIAYRALYCCSRMASIAIPNSVTSIGEYAFSDCSSLTNVYYKGTKSDWAKISIGNGNSNLTNATRYYYSENEPTLNAEGTAYDGNYWHYVNGVATPWIFTKE